jgi:hypothetical protein
MLLLHLQQDNYFEAQTQGIPHDVHMSIYYIHMNFNSTS